MIRDECTEATGGRTINPFWVTGSTGETRNLYPFSNIFFSSLFFSFFFPFFFFFFFLLFFSLYFSVPSVQSIFGEKITVGKL